MRIAILGLHHDTNQGDSLICQTVKKLYEREFNEDILWDELDLNFRRYFNGLPEEFITKIGRKLYRLSDSLYRKTGWNIFKWLCVIFLSWAFVSKVKHSQAGIIAGGGIIHHKYHDYAIGIAAFIRASHICKIPVIVNGVGVEGYDSCSIRCKILKKYLSYSTVKFISSRDDINLIKGQYIEANRQSDKIFSHVVDPAIFCSELFGIKRIYNPDTIGIGLIRGTIFNDYKVECSSELLVDFYCGIIDKCRLGGVKYELFINGYQGDLDIVKLLENRLGERLTVAIPNSPHELIKTISNYKCIITARMHSCIVAYSLGIPAVALIWCEKLKFWGETIHKPECFLPIENLDADLAWKRMKNALCHPYDENIRADLEECHLKSVKIAINIIRNYSSKEQ